MKNFNKQELLEKNHFEDDKGIKINKLLQIIEDSDYYQNILDYFKLDKDDDTFIEIPGGKNNVYNIALNSQRL